jgi:hypothetical protein
VFDRSFNGFRTTVFTAPHHHIDVNMNMREFQNLTINSRGRQPSL